MGIYTNSDIKSWNRARVCVAQVVKRLTTMPEVLGSIPSVAGVGVG
jgi:hypothetical protein